MKRFWKASLLLIAMLLGAQAIDASMTNKKQDASDRAVIVLNEAGGYDFSLFTPVALADLTPDKVEALTGKKMSFKEAMALKAAQKTMKKQLDGDEPATGKPKSQIVAAVLCWFFGVIGIHRFYLGYTWQGVVQILTMGGCGIWTLIDFIRILMGDLKPANGSDYDPAF